MGTKSLAKDKEPQLEKNRYWDAKPSDGRIFHDQDLYEEPRPLSEEEVYAKNPYDLIDESDFPPKEKKGVGLRN